MAVKTYTKKKGIPFKAIKWNGLNDLDVIDFVGSDNIEKINYDKKVIVITLGNHKYLFAHVGDYISVSSDSVNVFNGKWFEEMYEEVRL